MKKTLSVVSLFLLLCLGIGAQSSPAISKAPQHIATVASAPSSDTAGVRQETFDIVWRTVKDKHFDPTLGGLDWDKIREQYAPLAAAAKTDTEFYAVLRQMLGELHQSHFNIIPPEAIVADDSSEPKGGGIGVDLRIVEGQATITHVDAGSPAARAGLRPGFIIKMVDATSSEQVIAQFSKSRDSKAMQLFKITRLLIGRINGDPNTQVKISYLDERDQSHEVDLTRERLKGEMSQSLGNFPPQYTEFEAKRLENGIGYIRFNVFVMLLMDRFKTAIRGMSDVPGIIFDVRGNPGGVGGMASGIAGLLEKDQVSLGTMHMRSGHTNFAAFPQAKAYLGPVVIITDGGSASTSEVFAAGMQELGRATIVGERSVGAALPSVFQKLPTGALFQYAIADYKTPKGTLIEGRGVVPNVESKLTRRALLEGRDPQLDAAIVIINEQSKERKAAAGRSSF